MGRQTITNPTLQGTPNLLPTQSLTADGAITIKQGLALLSKTGSAGAFTLALPTVDGLLLQIRCTTAQAHVVTTPAAGVDGVSTTMTFSASNTNSALLISRAGSWYVCARAGLTIT
jgi:hypothetical protein